MKPSKQASAEYVQPVIVSDSVAAAAQRPLSGLSESVAQHIVRNSPSLIVSIDREHRVTFANDALLRTFGYSAEELVGRDWWSLAYPGEKQRQIERLFSDFETDGEVRAYELTVETKSGEDRVIRWNSVNRFEPNGDILEIIGIGEDVTEQRRAEIELHSSEARLATFVPASVFAGSLTTIGTRTVSSKSCRPCPVRSCSRNSSPWSLTKTTSRSS